MRKYLIITLIVIFIILIGTSVVEGFEIAGFNILSISNIMEESQNLDTRIEKINEKNVKDYKSLEDDLETKSKELKKQKENYADIILFNSEEGQAINNLYEKYEIEYLWTKLGNYATKNHLTMKLEVTNGTRGVEGMYNLNFTLNGEYVSIIDCIKGIEDDSTLGFKIENFSLTKGENGLQAIFTVKDVTINKIEQNTNTSTSTTQNSNTNTTNNTTNNTNNVNTNTNKVQ